MFNHSLISKYLLTTHHVPGTILGSANVPVNKTESLLSTRGSSYSRCEKGTVNQSMRILKTHTVLIEWLRRRVRQGEEIRNWKSVYREQGSYKKKKGGTCGANAVREQAMRSVRVLGLTQGPARWHG